MEDSASALSFLKILDKKIPINGILLILWGFMAYNMISNNNRMDRSIALIQKDISHIQKNLGNHIGDTNDKIDSLRKNQDERFDRQDKRFDDLYQFLLKNKK